MAKIYERLLSTIKLRENRRDSFDPQRENLLARIVFVWLLARNTASDILFFLLHD